jgi:hypothetical protein
MQTGLFSHVNHVETTESNDVENGDVFVWCDGQAMRRIFSYHHHAVACGFPVPLFAEGDQRMPCT